MGSSAEIHLEGLRMNAVQTAEAGVIDARTVFEFHQATERVWAEYAGGRIERGYLVGLLSGGALTFRYCQLQTDGALDGGSSTCEVRRGADELVQIVEHFAWESRAGSGTNVIQELRD